MDVVEQVGNALSDGAGNISERQLAADSDAVPSVLYPEQQKLGTLLANAEGGPSAALRGLQAITAGAAVVWLAVADDALAAMAGMAQPNDLLRVSAALIGMGVLPIVLTLGSAHTALKPGGTLEQLGVGEQKISEADARRLGRWRAALLGVVAFWFFFGLFYLAMGLTGVDPVTGRELSGVQRALNAAFGLLLLTVFPVLFAGWFPAMQTASCLCRDSVTEAIKKVRAYEPAANGDEAWEEVAASVLALREPMERLSAGFGPGLLGLAAGLLTAALAAFTWAINAEMCDSLDAKAGAPPGFHRSVYFGAAACIALFPLLLASDLAETSSRCDMLVDTLNDAAIEHRAQRGSILEMISCLRGLVRIHHPSLQLITPR